MAQLSKLDSDKAKQFLSEYWEPARDAIVAKIDLAAIKDRIKALQQDVLYLQEKAKPVVLEEPKITPTADVVFKQTDRSLPVDPTQFPTTGKNPETETPTIG